MFIAYAVSWASWPDHLSAHKRKLLSVVCHHSNQIRTGLAGDFGGNDGRARTVLGSYHDFMISSKIRNAREFDSDQSVTESDTDRSELRIFWDYSISDLHPRFPS
jgi:hypothetical protein